MNTLNDLSLSVIADYLHRFGHHHPDNVRDQSHHFVGLAKQRLRLDSGSTAASQESDEMDDPRLPRVTLEAAMEELFFPPSENVALVKPRRQVIPRAGARTLRPNETPPLVGPLRAKWWMQMASRHIQKPVLMLSRSASGKDHSAQPEALTDGQ